MTYYRLLRDNKETGPFAEDEMIARGFKPYDLIWVEGRSAGWRYPSEIPAFKNYAPAIEEQPYDRFYKKQPAQKLFSGEERNTPAALKNISALEKETQIFKKENDTVQPQQFPSIAASQSTPDYTIQPLPGRHIHVTLPSGNTVNLTTLVAKKENKEFRESTEVNYTPPAATKQTVFTEPVYKEVEPIAKQTNKNIITPAPLEIADEANMQYSDQQFEYRSAEGFSWGLIAASFIGFATLVGLGIMIGIGISKGKNEAALNEMLKNKSSQTVQPQYNANNNKPSASPYGASVTNETMQPASTPGKELVQNAVVKNIVVADNNSEPKENKKLSEEKVEATRPKPLPAADIPAVINKTAPVINVEKSLSLTPNDFKTGAFGGISGLKYTLFNGSKFPLESVEIEIDYIQANDKVFKTEKLLFKDVSAGTQATVEAPSSSRGVKLTTRIIKVNAKEAGLVNTTAKS